MGNVRRNRPRFKVGDIVEEYYWDIDYSKTYISTFLITEVVYKRATQYKNSSYRHKMKQRGGTTSPLFFVYRWHYTTLELETGEVETFRSKGLDRSISKKVG